MAISDINSLYIQELRHLYDAERQLIDALPRVARAADCPQLIEAVQHHYSETRKHASRLEEIFNDLGTSPAGPECKAMQGLIEETEQMISAMPKGAIRDAALILGAQKVEHYEIAGYGTACEFAKLLDHDKHVDLLSSTLEEESTANEKLTDVATSKVNDAALSASRTHQSAGSR